MTPDSLRELLLKVGAVGQGDGYVGRCGVCQPDETDPTEFKLNLSPGRSYPVLLFCHRCGEKGNREVNKRVSWHCLRSFGMDPREYLTPNSKEEIDRIWAAVGVATKRPESQLPADPDLLHAVYSDLLAELDLTDKHARWLKKRGLDADWAFGAGYRSTPTDSNPIAKKIWSRWSFRLGVVPGFSGTLADSTVRVHTRQQAILTPSRDCYGRVLALKQRMLDGGRGRMRLLSGGGVRAVNQCHVPLGVGGHRWKTLYVTEGERKADVFFCKTGQAVIGVPGTGAANLAVPLVELLLDKGASVTEVPQ